MNVPKSPEVAETINRILKTDWGELKSCLHPRFRRLTYPFHPKSYPNLTKQGKFRRRTGETEKRKAKDKNIQLSLTKLT